VAPSLAVLDGLGIIVVLTTKIPGFGLALANRPVTFVPIREPLPE